MSSTLPAARLTSRRRARPTSRASCSSSSILRRLVPTTVSAHGRPSQPSAAARPAPWPHATEWITPSAPITSATSWVTEAIVEASCGASADRGLASWASRRSCRSYEVGRIMRPSLSTRSGEAARTVTRRSPGQDWRWTAGAPTVQGMSSSIARHKCTSDLTAVPRSGCRFFRRGLRRGKAGRSAGVAARRCSGAAMQRGGAAALRRGACAAVS